MCHAGRTGRPPGPRCHLTSRLLYLAIWQPSVGRGGTMRLIGSSNPGDVERDTAVYHLAERAVLTRAVCRELFEANGEFGGRRPRIALNFLMQWIQEYFPESVRQGTPLSYGIGYGTPQMAVPDDCGDLLQEIRDGASVSEALMMLWTADTEADASHDEAAIRDKLADYFAKHPSAVRALTASECSS